MLSSHDSQNKTYQPGTPDEKKNLTGQNQDRQSRVSIHATTHSFRCTQQSKTREISNPADGPLSHANVDPCCFRTTERPNGRGRFVFPPLPKFSLDTRPMSVDSLISAYFVLPQLPYWPRPSPPTPPPVPFPQHKPAQHE